MESVDLMDQIETILKDAEAAIARTTDPNSAAICSTILACTRALCCEVAALRQVADSIDTDLSSIDLKLPDQN